MWELKNRNKDIEINLVNNGKHKIVARLISQRNIKEEEVDEFLNPDYSNLTNPYEFHDMEKACDLFIEVANKKGKVAIIGDYDCDGVMSSTMLKELCNAFKLESFVFLPSRLEHGYGLNPKTIKAFLETKPFMPDLLIVTDCGMNNFKEIETLRNNGLEKIIIIDHHMGNKEDISFNADAIVSWHLSENIHEMCASGEVFQFIRGIRHKAKKPNPIEFLSYAAIATIADVMPIYKDNRILVKNGLTQYALNHVIGMGLMALLKESKIHTGYLTQEDVSFKIAPRINAVGRIDRPDKVLDLLLERDASQAGIRADEIVKYNDERKKIQKSIEVSVHEQIKNIPPEDMSHGIFVCNKDWHIGVVGIVASRIVEIYGKPSVIVGNHNGIWKGSGRSLESINVRHVLDDCAELFDGYGGHAAAVGVTVKDEQKDNCQKYFNEACKNHFEAKPKSEIINYFDAKLKPQAISKDLCEIIINEMYPFCSESNQEPLFLLENVQIQDVNLVEKATWKLLKFSVAKDGYKIPYSFKTFSPSFGSEIDGKYANIVFSFPQKTKDPLNFFFAFDMNAVNIELI